MDDEKIDQAIRVFRERLECKGASDTEMYDAILILLCEAHDFIAEKVKNTDKWPRGMRAVKQMAFVHSLGLKD